MRFYPVKTPRFVQSLYPDYIWSLPSDSKTLYLSFDDGPTPGITEFVLEQLKLYHAKATFFCIGKNICKNKDLFYQIQSEGHAIGNHTYNHLKGWETSLTSYVDSVARTKEVIEEILGEGDSFFKSEPLLFRPPYGKIKSKQRKALLKKGYQIVMWDVLSLDWNVRERKEKVVENVIKNSKSGSIIVFHDSLKAAKNLKYALPLILEHFSRKGYSFQKIS